MIKIPAKVLIVDDEKDFVEMFSLRLTAQGEKVSTAYSGKDALTLLGKVPIVEVILLTGHGSTETVVEGMKLGAFDYLMKPADFDEIKLKLENARKRKDEQEERIRKAEVRLLLRRSGDI